MATCNAGHGCSITCPNGCAAIYNHDTGECTTWCESSATAIDPKELGGTFNIEINDMSPSVLADVIGETLMGARFKTLSGSGERVTLKMEDADLSALLGKLAG